MSASPRPSQPLDPGPSALVVAVFLLLVTIVAYLPAIPAAGFHFDDGHHVVENPDVRLSLFAPAGLDPAAPDGDPPAPGLDVGRFVSRLAGFYSHPEWFSGEPGNQMYRPTLMVVHALNYAATGYVPSGWIFCNLLCHALVVLGVWRLAVGLGLDPRAAVLAGLVMALHPVHTEVVNYVSSRSESVAAALMLGALLLHLAGRRRDGSGCFAWYAGAGVLSALAITAKETTAGFFLAVGLLELLVPGPREEDRQASTRVRRAVLFSGAYLLVLVAVMMVREHYLGHAASNLSSRLVRVREGADPLVGHGRSVLGNLLLQSRVVVLYQQLLARPAALSVDPGVSVSAGWAPVVAAIALHLGVAAAAVRAALRGKRLAPLCVAWFWLFLAPSIVVPLNVLMNEHRLYLPGIAVALAAGAWLWQVRGALVRRGWAPTRAQAAVALPLLLFVCLAMHRTWEWRSDRVLWETAVVRAPTSPRAQLHLGAVDFLEARRLQGEERLALLDDALDRFEEADRLHPRWLDAQMNLGNTWLARARITRHDADFERALACYDAMGEIAGRETERWRMSRAEALTEWGRYDEAVAVIDELDAADDSVTPIYDEMRARSLRRKGDVRGARENMRRVIDLQRGRAKQESLLTLGWWYYEDAVAVRGRPSEADALLQRSAALLGEARDMAQTNGAYRPNLYMARFLRLMGVQLDQAQKWEDEARELGWLGIESELAWVNGGPTPGVRQGTPGAYPRR